MENGFVPQKSVEALLNANFKAIKSVLPKHMTPERMARIALIEVRRTPKLAQADPATLIGAVLFASQLGLEPGPQGFCHLIPYWNKSRNCVEVNFQLGYRGGMNLSRRSGDVGLFTAEAVYENDDFWYRLGTENVIHHVPTLDADRGKPTHYYANAKLISSGHNQFRVMSVAQVEEVRNRFSKSNQAGGFNPWRDNFEAMALKTCIIRNCKFLPTSAEVQKAVSLDEMADAGVAQNMAAELPFDLEIPADYESGAQAEKLNETANGIKRDLMDAEEEPAAVDELDMVPDGQEAGDDFDLMDMGAMDDWLEAKKEDYDRGSMTANLITSALKSGVVNTKRELARRISRD